ncbi:MULTISPECIES: DUF485 domain-containing protein [unclassified Streptomyces]|uniref:DUF485 domain-containing protein n=1 Tax=unclassified Streptomyces TaxID=2593676 RepID=UPI002DD895CE|nr:DUF485 domain-containing protein [Streptomyces sp. NBC_00243]WRZ21969.1 DUF485 domain-containing protein [Streptomyces sp. NBC_00243]
MPDSFSSPEYQPPNQHPDQHQRPDQHPYPQDYPDYSDYLSEPPDPPHNSSPSYLTYPWQPPPPEPVRRRTPRHRALGRHSDMRLLRTAYRRQRRVATLTALGYFVLFLVLSAFAPGLMTSRVSGGLSTGLLLGLLQVPVACLAIGLYEYTARRSVDPIADRIRKQTELDAKREAAR